MSSTVTFSPEVDIATAHKAPEKLLDWHRSGITVCDRAWLVAVQNDSSFFRRIPDVYKSTSFCEEAVVRAPMVCLSVARSLRSDAMKAAFQAFCAADVEMEDSSPPCTLQRSQSNETGYKGVTRVKDTNTYRARATDPDGKEVYIGVFPSNLDAASAIAKYHRYGKLPSVTTKKALFDAVDKSHHKPLKRAIADFGVDIVGRVFKEATVHPNALLAKHGDDVGAMQDEVFDRDDDLSLFTFTPRSNLPRMIAKYNLTARQFWNEGISMRVLKNLFPPRMLYHVAGVSVVELFVFNTVKNPDGSHVDEKTMRRWGVTPAMIAADARATSKSALDSIGGVKRALEA